jgi:RNA polymerase sigma factor (sigma-70 family)
MIRLFTYSDAELINWVRGSDLERDKALSYIVKTWKRDLAAVLVGKGATRDEIEYCIQESVIVLDKHIRAGSFRGESSVRTFFVSIGKQTFQNKDRWQIGFQSIEDNADRVEVDPKTPQNRLESQEIQAFVQQVLAALPSRCREVLRLYMNDLSNREIQEELKLPSEGAANYAAFDCRKKFKELCEKNSIFKQIKDELIGND